MTARTILTALLVLTTAFAGLAQGLRFRPDGTFKIAQFTDTHYIHGDARSDTAIKNIRHVMEAEQPDLVLLTGDIIYGKPAEQSYRDVLDAIAAYGVPFGVVFGNHDDEQGLDRAALLRLTQSYPLNVTRTEPGIHGFSNYALPIAGHAGPDTAAVIYCFDSNAYSQINGIKGYDYIRGDQVEWYRRTSRALTAAHGGTPLPAYAFFHIPLPEYSDAVADEDAPFVGTRKERPCVPALNSGLFTAMKECGDVRATFVGHDHSNDYAVLWHGILLAYGRFSGGNTVYNDLPNGARLIELHEDGQQFDTWVRLADGQVLNRATCPDSFLRK